MVDQGLLLAGVASITAAFVSISLALLRWKFSIDVIKFKAAINSDLRRLISETARKLEKSREETNELLSEAVSKVENLNFLKTRMDSFTSIMLWALIATVIGFSLFVPSVLLSDSSASSDLALFSFMAYFFGVSFIFLGLVIGRDLAAKYESLMVAAIGREGDALQEVRNLERRVSKIEKDRKM